MVVDSSLKPKEPEDKRSTKEKLLEEFNNFDETCCALAYYYAKGYELGGIDVTKVWEQIPRNMDALNRAYRKGFEDAMNLVAKQKEQRKAEQAERKKRKGKRR